MSTFIHKPHRAQIFFSRLLKKKAFFLKNSIFPLACLPGSVLLPGQKELKSRWVAPVDFSFVIRFFGRNHHPHSLLPLPNPTSDTINMLPEIRCKSTPLLIDPISDSPNLFTSRPDPPPHSLSYPP